MIVLTAAPVVIAVAIAFAVDRSFGWIMVAVLAAVAMALQVGMPA